MYQALYRKYRPSTFDKVVGQDVIIKTLKNAIQNNKLTHAYLFTGPRGTGKTSTAKILAKTINCQNLNNFEPCNQCVSCMQINNKQTTDIIEIDAASNNGVDEIRELKSKVNLVPSNSKYKVYIIDEVHMLSTGAFNALLKTLEDPPSHIIFILATTEPHKIPVTILSRCQKFDFKKISVSKIIENLKRIVEIENINIDEKAIKEIALLSNGGARDSLSILDQAISYCSENITCQDIHDINGTAGNEVMKNIVELLLNSDIVRLLKLFDELDEKGKKIIKLVEELVIYLRNILIYKIAPNYFDEPLSQELFDKNIKIDKKVLLHYIKKLCMSIYEMKNSDNEKIILELCLIELLEENREDYNNSVENLEKVEFSSDTKQSSKMIDQAVAKNTQKDIVSKKDLVPIEEKGINMVSETLISEIDKKMFEKIKKIRVNNALSCFNRKLLLEYKEKITIVKKYLFDEEYGQWASLILDGELKAIGKEYLIFVYKDEPMEYLFNQNWMIIETILEKIYNTEIKVVATNIEEWNTIKEEFNSKIKKYEWQEEPSMGDFKEKREKNQEINKIENLFKDIIEYSE